MAKSTTRRPRDSKTQFDNKQPKMAEDGYTLNFNVHFNFSEDSIFYNISQENLQGSM